MEMSEITQMIKYTLRFDGGACPNPGPYIGSYVIYEYKDGMKNIKGEGGKYMDKIGTNNHGEYLGLIEGMKKAIDLNIKVLHVESDAMLVICQMNEKWKAKNENLIELYNEVLNLCEYFDYIDFNHIYRHQNTYADSLYRKLLN
jgi:ribonuclease HI